MRKASGLSVVSEGMAVKLAHLLKIVKSSAAFFEKTNFEALSFTAIAQTSFTKYLKSTDISDIFAALTV
jgi:hypothetical protein